jgi:aspartyl-tRNA(Asn)/glutamyl-tRNA(Gln) amidotransferase subunit A
VPEVAEALPFGAPLYTAEAYGYWRALIESGPEKVFPPILERFRSGETVKAADFVAAWTRLRALREGYRAATAGFDAVILPTVASLPPDAGRLLADAELYLTENRLALRNTTLGNLMGVSALTLPTGTPSCGLMLMGPPFAEGRLLRLGAAAEAALA